MTKPEYTSWLHRHNFAVWAAARATQRGFTTVQNLKDALEGSGVTEFVDNPCGTEDFDALHRSWCNLICTFLRDKGIEAATYGRAAKLVNVYLKSMVVLPDVTSMEACYLHPPIDRLLLQAIASDPDVNETYCETLRKVNWTQLDEEEYFDLVSLLKEVNGDRPFWEIERYWSVTSATSS